MPPVHKTKRLSWQNRSKIKIRVYLKCAVNETAVGEVCFQFMFCWYPCIVRLKNRHVARTHCSGIKHDGWGVYVRTPVTARLFSYSLYRSERILGSISLLSSGFLGIFPRGWSDWWVKVTNHLQLVTRSKLRGSIHPSPYMLSWHEWSSGQSSWLQNWDVLCFLWNKSK
jgi:hypothetical protein